MIKKKNYVSPRTEVKAIDTEEALMTVSPANGEIPDLELEYDDDIIWN